MKMPRYTKVDTPTHQAESTMPQDPAPSKPKRPRCLVAMIASLLAGLALAIAQCLLYWYLSGKTVSSTIPQAWASRTGTALAFLVKLLFATAASIAYVQRQWLALSITSWEIRQIDTLTGILGNIILFRHFRLWLTHPLLLCLAIVTWLIPLAAIIAPGSLSVDFQPLHNLTNSVVPQYSYNYTSYGALRQTDLHTVDTRDLALAQASITLRRVAISTAMSGQISSMQPLFQNYTYEQRFYAPALRCFGANESIITNLTTSGYEVLATYQSLRFLAFTPTSQVDLSNVTDWTDINVYSGQDSVSQDVFRVFIVPNYELEDTIECNLHNASYTTQVTFQNGLQDLHLSQVDLLNEVAPVTLVPPSGVYTETGGLSQSDSVKVSYASTMLAFTHLLVGYAQVAHAGGTTTTQTSFDLTPIDWTTKGLAIEGLERLFQNITLSVLSVPDLIKNDTSAEKVTLDVLTFPLTYSFTPEDILIAYGLAFSFALLSVVMGLTAVISHGGSFQNIFSTFVRVTRAASLDFPPHTPDNGMDPLPTLIGGTKLRLSGAKTCIPEQVSTSTGCLSLEAGQSVQSRSKEEGSYTGTTWLIQEDEDLVGR